MGSNGDLGYVGVQGDSGLQKHWGGDMGYTGGGGEGGGSGGAGSGGPSRSAPTSAASAPSAAPPCRKRGRGVA